MLRKIITLFIFSWSILIFFASGIVESQDGLQYLTVARQIYYHQTFEMPAAKYPTENIHMNVQLGREGKEFAPTGLGFSLAYLPAVFFEDLFNRLSGVDPTENFPLDNDWPIMLFGSMTNAFFGAIIIVTFYLFLKSFSCSDRYSVFFAGILFCTSNLLPYSKHAFAHLLFVSFMWLSFYFLRYYRLTQHKKQLVFAALCYGVVILSYNPTFLLPLPALAIYYLTSLPWPTKKNTLQLLRTILMDAGIIILSILPFVMVYSWFNWVRFGGATTTGYGSGGFASLPVPPAFVVYEGLWGLLFSPGKSIFLFTPALLILILFWHKIKKKYLPEVITGLVLAITYLVFIASLVGGEDFYPWHGEASFGPRYILPILPFALLIVALIYQQLSSLQRRLVFWPIILFGFFVQLVGVLIPYQVRFSGLVYQYWLNEHRITYDVYANFLPRFSPLYSMSKWFIRKTILLPDYYLKSQTVKVVDGFHGPLPTSQGVWRQIEPVAVIEVDTEHTTEPLTLQVINHISTSSAKQQQYPLLVTASSPENELAAVTVATDSSSFLQIPIAMPTQEQKIILSYEYVGTPSAKLATQIPFISFPKNKSHTFLENGQYHYPYVSRVSRELFNQQYYYWGGINTNMWDLWNMRSINYMHTYDLWWLRPFHYWDLPKNFFLLLFLGNVSICMTSGYLLYKAVTFQRGAVKNKR